MSLFWQKEYSSFLGFTKDQWKTKVLATCIAFSVLGLAVTSSTHWESNAGSESCGRRRDLGTLHHVEDGRSWEHSSCGLHNPKTSEVLESGSRRIYRRGKAPVELGKCIVWGLEEPDLKVSLTMVYLMCSLWEHLRSLSELNFQLN